VDPLWWACRGADGLVHRAALLGTGVPEGDIGKALERHRVAALQRGIYLPGGATATALQAASAALRAVDEPGSAASHLTAAKLHGLAVPTVGREQITIPRPERRPHRDRLRLHTARLPAADVVEVDGVRVTGIARTLVDLCRFLPRVPAVWAVEDALRRDLVDRQELEESARRLARTPGVVRARQRFRAAEPRSGSPLETDARLRLCDAGLPCPEVQMEVQLAGGGRAFVDLGYRDAMVGIELDGREFHERPDALFVDRSRQNALLLSELVVLRFTWFDVVHRSQHFIGDVRRALRQRRAR
jgi:very-short-patch-repair endonuclease